MSISRYPSLLLLIFIVNGCSESPGLDPLHTDAVILAFGDSLTEGTGADEGQSYPDVLQQLSGRRVINAGRNGELSAQGLRRLPALLDRHNPGLLILCHGGNDILRRRDMQAMASNLGKMIDAAQSRGIPVVLLGVPRPGLFLSAADVYQEVAERAQVVYLDDVIADVLQDDELKSDPVHPNARGYRIIAEKVFASLQDAGAL